MDLVLGFPKGWRMVLALCLIVDNHGKPTLLGICGKWPHVIFFNPTEVEDCEFVPVHHQQCENNQPQKSAVMRNLANYKLQGFWLGF